MDEHLLPVGDDGLPWFAKVGVIAIIICIVAVAVMLIPTRCV